MSYTTLPDSKIDQMLLLSLKRIENMNCAEDKEKRKRKNNMIMNAFV